MTTKVVKGSLWTLIGTASPMLVSFISTPIVIRLLGPEAFGILILIGLVPAYFGFSDLGMGIASTKFGSEAFALQNREREAQIVRTAIVVAFSSTILITITLFLGSKLIVRYGVSISSDLQARASIALSIAAFSLLISNVAGVINTPQLTRLRMDLNTYANAIPKIMMGVLTPIVLFFGGDVVAATVTAALTNVLILTLTSYFSMKLLPELAHTSIDLSQIRPLVKFGLGWILAGVAAMFLVNAEKFLLARYVSVKSLAYYSVAFTLANIATVFSNSMVQSLLPAFSQLIARANGQEIENLMSRAIRVSLIWLLPSVYIMVLFAKSFFYVWAGPEFAINSTLPFYALLVGLIFNVLAFVPHSAITAAGRTTTLAKLYWLELIVYAVVAFSLVSTLEVVGAAIAWTIRVVIDSLILVYLAMRFLPITPALIKQSGRGLLCGSVFVPGLLTFWIFDPSVILTIVFVFLSICSYIVLAWRYLLSSDERRFVIEFFRLKLLWG